MKTERGESTLKEYLQNAAREGYLKNLNELSDYKDREKVLSALFGEGVEADFEAIAASAAIRPYDDEHAGLVAYEDGRALAYGRINAFNERAHMNKYFGVKI